MEKDTFVERCKVEGQEEDKVQCWMEHYSGDWRVESGDEYGLVWFGLVCCFITYFGNGGSSGACWSMAFTVSSHG
ncbi:hypothetical protein V6N12_036037 [Hibiscus sabdariffa]|uniref:Uncharacterized protein n=1 Tax=Hibiscus sabdariffa TaxID=183260 RepID=A0ABR2EPF9_9ROSI